MSNEFAKPSPEEAEDRAIFEALVGAKLVKPDADQGIVDDFREQLKLKRYRFLAIDRERMQIDERVYTRVCVEKNFLSRLCEHLKTSIRAIVAAEAAEAIIAQADAKAGDDVPVLKAGARLTVEQAAAGIDNLEEVRVMASAGEPLIDLDRFKPKYPFAIDPTVPD